MDYFDRIRHLSYTMLKDYFPNASILLQEGQEGEEEVSSTWAAALPYLGNCFYHSYGQLSTYE